MKLTIAALASFPFLVSACASDLAQGYRSTPDYPAYAQASDGHGDSVECVANLAGMAAARHFEKQAERQIGRNVKSGNPSGSDWFGALTMAFVFAIAQDRPVDTCAAAASAESSARRRDGY